MHSLRLVTELFYGARVQFNLLFVMQKKMHTNSSKHPELMLPCIYILQAAVFLRKYRQEKGIGKVDTGTLQTYATHLHFYSKINISLWFQAETSSLYLLHCK